MNCDAADTDHLSEDDENLYPAQSYNLTPDQERQIKELAQRIEQYYQDVIQISNEVESQVTDVEIDKEALEQIRIQCRGIISILRDTERTRIFIGSTSQGKSTFINAYLRRKVLPCGLGSTTSQIVEVRGHKGRSYNVSKTLRKRDERRSSQLSMNREFKDAESLGQHVLEVNKKERERVNSLHLQVPVTVFPMLRDNVVLIDSPGMGYEDSYNEAVSKESKSVRTVILVCNLETDLTQMDMEYMRRLCNGATPAICFIVMNKWDRALVEIKNVTERDELRAVQTERCVKFLVDEINLEPEEAERRVFFLSGLAVLNGEPEATESFEEFFKVLQLKEEEALSMRNIPEHQKSLAKMATELNTQIADSVQKYESLYEEMRKKIHESDVITKEDEHVRQTIELKVPGGIHDVVEHYTEKLDGSQDITEAQAKNLLRDFIRTTEDNIDNKVMEEINKFSSAVKDHIITVMEGDAKEKLKSRLEDHKPDEFHSNMTKEKKAMRYLDVLQWDSFKVTETVQTDMKHMKRTLGSLRESFRSRRRAKEAAQEAKEAKVAYAVATQKVMLEMTEDMKQDFRRSKPKRSTLSNVCWLTWCCGACSCLACCHEDINPCGCRQWRPCRFCGCGGAAQRREEEQELTRQMSERASKRIIERSKKIQHDLKQDRMKEDNEDTEVPLLEVPELDEGRRLTAAIREEYKDRLNKVQKMAPELTQVVLEKANKAVDKTLEEILQISDGAIDNALQQTAGDLNALKDRTEDINTRMDMLATDARELFTENR